jgi:hypothetical protein
MCHRAHIHVVLSAEEKKDAKKLVGILIPAYASILLGLVVFVAISGGSRQGELIASAPTSAATR